MRYQPQDRFFKKAKQEGFAARSVYKLQEIDQKFRVFKKGQRVLDLGASPGSWSQYAIKKIMPDKPALLGDLDRGDTGSGGVPTDQARFLLGIDLSPVTVQLEGAHFIAADLRDLKLRDVIVSHGFPEVFDVVMSDMMANTTGIKSVDQARSLELCELALQIAQQHLRPGGVFITKFFQSGEFGALRAAIRKEFSSLEILKPESTRSISKEIFLVGLGKKQKSQSHSQQQPQRQQQ